MTQDTKSNKPAPNRGNDTYGSDLVVDLLEKLGAEYVFINPGSSFRGIHDSLVNYHGNTAPEIVLATHEMTGVAMAHGYWKATGKPPVCILHNLVGLMSGSMSIFNAYCDQIPMLVLGGSGPADPKERRFVDWAHSANTQGDLIRSYVKWTDEPVTLEASLDSILRAWRKANTQPFGPVYVSIDAGQQEAPAPDIALPDPAAAPYRPPAPVYPHPDQVAAAVDALLAAKQPLIMGGRFGLNPAVTAPLVELVELLGAAYIEDRAIACFPSEHPLNLTGDRAARDGADLLLCFDSHDLTASVGRYGSHRSGIAGLGNAAGEATIIDVSMNDYFGNSWTYFGGPIPPRDIQITSDALLGLEQILKGVKERLAGQPDPYAARRNAVAQRHADLAARKAAQLDARWDESPIALERVTDALYRAVADKDWVLTVRNHRTWAEGYWKFQYAGQYLGGDGGAGVGYGAGAAVGAALGLKGTGKIPVAMFGDGDFMMTPGALWTACHHEAPLLVVLLNNRSWGNDELHQREIATQRGRDPGTAFIGQTTYAPDAQLTLIAQGFGARTFGPVDDPAQLDTVFAEAVAAVEAGAVVVVEVTTALE